VKQFIILLVLLFFSYNIFAQNSKQNISVGMTISIPFISNYKYYDYEYNNSTDKTIYLGFGFSLFYKHHKIKYSLSTTPFIQLYNNSSFCDCSKTITVQYWEALAHYNFIKRLNVIGGINLAYYKYEAGSILPGYSFTLNKNDNTIGFTTGLEYMFSKTISIAALYRPALYSDGIKSYKRTISLDARFDIRCWNKK